MKILSISNDKTVHDRIIAALGESANNHKVGSVEMHALKIPDELSVAPADLIIIEGITVDSDAWPAIERVVAKRPEVSIILTSQNQTPDLLKIAMHHGIRDVVSPDEDSLREVLSRMIKRQESIGEKATGKIISFLPAKFSSGSTFLATSLCYSLSSRSHKKVLLIDLNMECGDSSLFISDKEPVFTLADVCREINRLDASLLSACSITPYAGLSVLAAPGDPEKILQVKPEHISAILGIAKANYDYVILDVDRAMSAISILALDSSDIIFAVIQETLPYLRDAKRLSKIFSGLDYPHDKVSFVVNRHTKDSDITISDIEKTLDTKIRYAIPNSYKNVTSAINQGVPLATIAPKDSIIREINLMADGLGAAPASSEGWLSKIFKN